VLGSIAQSELLESAIPETQVQGNARVDYAGSMFAPWVLGAPYANEAALCQAFVRQLANSADGKPPRGELCRKLPDATVTGTLVPAIRAVERYRLVVPSEMSTLDTTALVVRSDQGLYPANLALSDNRNAGLCPGGPEGDMKVGGFRAEGGVLLIERTRYFTPGVYMVSAKQNTVPPAAAASVLRCRLGGRLLCREFITQFGEPTYSLRLDGTWDRAKLPKLWNWTRTLALSGNGVVRLSPCNAPNGDGREPRVVPCATPGAEEL
jgi:hypothetical protein